MMLFSFFKIPKQLCCRDPGRKCPGTRGAFFIFAVFLILAFCPNSAFAADANFKKLPLLPIQNSALEIPRYGIYEVKKGDKLTKLYGKNWPLVALANGLVKRGADGKYFYDARNLQAGMLLKIPPGLDEIGFYAGQAGERFGIAPATLLSIAEIETKFGTWPATGNWLEDIKDSRSKDRDCLKKLADKWGIDPGDIPVSRAPKNYSGSGGALGFMQFMPCEWLKYEKAIAIITGHKIPSPWNWEDAFTAAAIKLAQDKEVIAYDIAYHRARINGLLDNFPAKQELLSAEDRAVGKYFAGDNRQNYGWYIAYVKNIREFLRPFLK